MKVVNINQILTILTGQNCHYTSIIAKKN